MIRPPPGRVMTREQPSKARRARFARRGVPSSSPSVPISFMTEIFFSQTATALSSSKVVFSLSECGNPQPQTHWLARAFVVATQYDIFSLFLFLASSSCLVFFLLLLSFFFYLLSFFVFRFLVFSFLHLLFFSFFSFFPIDLRLSCVCVVIGASVVRMRSDRYYVQYIYVIYN